MLIANRQNIAGELSPKCFVTRSAGLDIYMVDAESAPRALTEIGRIRELEFRREGGGTGKDVDLDRYDLLSPRYRQLIAWDPQEEEIVAMYRFFRGADLGDSGGELASAEIFEFSPRFLSDYLPHTIELGRSVVNRSARRSYRGLFAVWSGLGALVREYSDARYFFGKFTVSPTLNSQLRRAMYAMLSQWCGGDSGLVSPRPDCQIFYDHAAWEQGVSFKDDLSRLVVFASGHGASIPPLVLSYARLTDKLQVFGTALNSQFGNVEETAILIPIEYISARIRQQFIDSYTSINPEIFA